MANNILGLTHTETGNVLYLVIWDVSGKVFDANDDLIFESYVSNALSDYAIIGSELGTASRRYNFIVPASVPAGTYTASVYHRAGGSPAEGDTNVGNGYFEWNGSSIIGLSDVVDEIIGNDVGTGQIMVDHNYGGTDNLSYLTDGDLGIDNATVTVYLTSDYDAGLTSPAHVIAHTTTDVNGHWVSALMLDPADYTIVYNKQHEYGPDVMTVTVS